MAACPPEYKKELAEIARIITTPGKGLLAADESLGTAGKRLASVGLPNEVEHRQAFRDLLFTACPKHDLKQYLNGVIFFEESLFQTTKDGKPFPNVVRDAGILVGIKVDMGTVPLAGTDNETSTQGLDKLSERLQKYYQAGARFAKWRSVLRIGKNEPSELAIRSNAYVLARYASLCQANRIVPIVEPEILMDGDHDIQTATRASVRVLSAVFKELHDHHVYLEGTVLKPNMVTAGQDFPGGCTPQEVGHATVDALRQTVPSIIPGITFLSGGQSEEEATVNLNAINQVDLPKPWTLTFSFARGLQATVLKAWQGKPENVAAGQEALMLRLKANSEASLGKYTGAAGNAAGAQESLFVKDYQY